MILNLRKEDLPLIKGLLYVMMAIGISGVIVFGGEEISRRGCSLKSDQRLISEMKSSDLNVKLKAISTLIKRGNPVVNQPEVIDWLVSSAANLLDEEANWTNPTLAWKFYNTLKRIEPEILPSKRIEPELVISSLTRHLFKPEIRLRTLFIGIKLGLPGSEEKFIAVLNKHGDKLMAEDFLNSGSKRLYEGGREWAERNGYIISAGSGSHRARFGSF